MTLREQRRGRLFEAMEGVELDVLVLGRRPDVAYATGAQSLWTAGTRPFGAACVLVAAERSVHLLSSWDEGVPPEIPFDHLYGVTWNPAVMGEALRAVPGFCEAARLGVDAWSPGFARAVARLAPSAELVVVDELMDEVRRVKLPGELELLRAAADTVRRAFGAVVRERRSGGTEAQLLGVAFEVMADRGTTIPTTVPTVRALTAGLSDVTVGAGDRPVGHDDLLLVDLGFLVDGYEGSIARTIGPGSDPDFDPSGANADRQSALLAACRPGATGAELQKVAGAAGSWSVRGSGLGAELPVITSDIGTEAELVEGMVLAVEVTGPSGYGTSHGRRDLALVGGAGAIFF